MTYTICKKTIESQKAKGILDREDMTNKLDVFLLANRLTEEEYDDLLQMLKEE